jgi:RNA polymerase sigma-70 factor, ECF subfamily
VGIPENQKIENIRLIQLVALHQQDALGELYDRYGRLLYSIAMLSIGDPATAEEIVQDVFAHVWEKANSYDPAIASVTTWLCSITRHRAIDELRRRNVRPEKDSIDWTETENFPMDSQYRFSETEEAVEFAWQQGQVKEAVYSLPPEQRDALALAYFKGYSQSKIAETLGIPLGTVKTRIRLAMQKLRLVIGRAVTVDPAG